MKPILGLIFALLLTLPAALVAAENNPAKPNVLLIILEDWGPYLHCYGEQAINTPSLDQLASEVAWRHVNLLGEYDFSDEKLRDSIGIRLPAHVDWKAAAGGL